MKRREYISGMSIEDWMKHTEQDDEYSLADLACRRMMKKYETDFDTRCEFSAGGEFDNKKCLLCVQEYLNEEVDENGKAIGND